MGYITYKSKKKKSRREEGEKMISFFFFYWDKYKPHNCANCGIYLGKEPKTYMFDHLLEKSKYPELKYEELNICYLCLNCHDRKSRGFIPEKIQKLIDKVKSIFNII
jgi:5-methylcytosine-specific restriction endonuclease McrA